MRELKFRAWDNLEKRMRKAVSLHWQGDKLVSAKLEGDNEPIPIKGRLEIEQYTGLRGRNGAEIYEGDIVDFSSYSECDYLDDAGPKVFKFPDDYAYLSSMDNLEVIGNVHENPELLKRLSK